MSDQTNAVKTLVGHFLANLNPRNRDIISRRFGLKTGHRETLESIGQSYDITRERVRQIEEASLAVIREQLEGAGHQQIEPFVLATGQIIGAHGGVVREEQLFKEYSGSNKESASTAALSFILTLDGGFYRHPEDDEFRAFWASSEVHARAFKEALASLVSGLDKHGSVVAQTAMADFNKQYGLKLTSQEIENYLDISKIIALNVFEELGLTKWAEVHPRGVRDKSYLVLKKEGKPKHFREIASLINDARFSDRKAHIQTVHNELIKDKRFVLVGRGTYALSEWGYKPGTVKEVIADLIRQNGPMAKDKIVAEVMSARFVKPNTVVLGMQDKSLFKDAGDGRIGLKEV